MRAGHLPTMRFHLSDWQAMRVFIPDGVNWAGEGYVRSHIRGIPIVVYNAPLDSGKISYAVRPIVRVPMGSARI